MKIWKDIEGYEGLYKVSNEGDVYSLRRKKCMSLINDKDGYKKINLVDRTGKMHTYQVHRLVAKAFISNPENYRCINHKDEIKHHNNVENLEWCTHRYNSNYGTIKEKISKGNSKAVVQLTKDDEIVMIWQSATECAKELGFTQGEISRCCHGARNNLYKGFVWKFAEDMQIEILSHQKLACVEV